VVLGQARHMILEVTLVITRSKRPFRLIVFLLVAFGSASGWYVDALSIF
jgi:hypothetical protein